MTLELCQTAFEKTKGWKAIALRDLTIKTQRDMDSTLRDFRSGLTPFQVSNKNSKNAITLGSDVI